MNISSSALASLVIAGTAIGGSTFAVMANTPSTDMNSSNISQITDTNVPGTIPGESVAPVDENGNPQTITPVNPGGTSTPKPTSSSKIIAPTLPPVDFGGKGDDDDSESEDGDYEDGDYEDGNDDSYNGSYEDESDDDDGYGHHDDDEEDDD